MTIYEFIKIFDYTILSFWHSFAVNTSNIFTPIIRTISYAAEVKAGLPLVLLAIILMFFKRTRKVGIAMFISMAIGIILTNGLIKNYVARLRPYQSDIKEYLDWWKYVGSVKVSEYSFPSGHTTLTMAAMTSLFFFTNKKYSWTAFIFVILMGISRNYLMVHYPTDVLGGVLIGFVSAIIGGIITQYIYYIALRHQDHKFFYYFIEKGFGPHQRWQSLDINYRTGKRY